MNKNKKNSKNKEKKESKGIKKVKKKNNKEREYNIYKEITPKKIDKKEKNTKKIKKIKLILVIIFIILIIGYTGIVVLKLIKNPTDTFIVANGKLSKEETINGYIIRDETIVEGENYKNRIIKIKEEGQRVAKGDSVFRYYSSNEDVLEKKIAELDEKIQEVIEGESNTFSSDQKLLETQIEKQLDDIYQKNEIQKIQEYKKNINTYITKKAKIVGELSPSGSNLNKLIEERSVYEKQLNSEAEYVIAPISGVVSYKVDGLEKTLNTNDFGKLNKELLEKLNLKAGQIIANNEQVGKIINNYMCYMIFNSNSEEAILAKVNDKIKIKIQNNKEITATIINIIEENDKSKTIAIKLNKNVEELIAYRKISFDIIWWNAEGFRIPNSAIRKIGEINYVIRNRNGYLNKMAVKILKKDEEYCIVEQYLRNELIEMGLDLSEISELKNITLYDEILLNPTEEQILQ